MFIQFSHPWFLLLGILLAFIWYISRRGHPLLSATRRRIALLLRLLILTFLILALAGIKISLPTRDRTIFFLLDISESINAQNRKTAEDYIKKSLEKMKEGDKAGIIVFARQAFVESLPQSRLEFSHLLTRVNADYTNIVAALELAVANFPQKGSKRIVLLSDGNQNRKEARVLLGSLTKKTLHFQPKLFYPPFLLTFASYPNAPHKDCLNRFFFLENIKPGSAKKIIKSIIKIA